MKKKIIGALFVWSSGWWREHTTTVFCTVVKGTLFSRISQGLDTEEEGRPTADTTACD